MVPSSSQKKGIKFWRGEKQRWKLNKKGRVYQEQENRGTCLREHPGAWEKGGCQERGPAWVGWWERAYSPVLDLLGQLRGRGIPQMTC